MIFHIIFYSDQMLLAFDLIGDFLFILFYHHNKLIIFKIIYIIFNYNLFKDKNIY